MTTPVLYRWQPGWGLSSISPACIQVEAYLRFATLDFAVEECNYGRTSPTGQHPALDSNGDIITEDEEFHAARTCIRNLQQDVKDLDGELSSSDRADLAAFASLLQASVEPATLYTTWVEEESFSRHTQVLYGQGLPLPLRSVLTRLHRYQIQRQLQLSNANQIYSSLSSAFDAIAERLDQVEGNFFFGSKPSSLDALLFGHLAFLMAAPVAAPEIRQQIDQRPILKAYVDQLSKEYFQRAVPCSSGKVSKEWRQRADQASNPSRPQQQQHNFAEEELNSRGKVWLFCAVAAVGAFTLLCGQYSLLAVEDVDLDLEDV